MKRARVRIYGIVQGVFFRANTKEMALRLGISGWVRNMPDGSVEAVFEGDDDAIEKMIKWCHRGPAMARVERVYVEYEEPRGEKEFKIIY
ncbi:MAG: acylphosphatase [Thermoplasmata archaeon]|nr:MAG: acylphosphatase [Thermoplasmata archaeon]